MTTYDRIGINYNATRRADPYILGRLYHLLAPVPGSCYLDVGCGTGNYTAAMSEKDVNITGVDPSAIMLKEARGRHGAVSWLQAAVEQLPLANNTFAGAMATFTVHHWQDMDKGFAEIARVLIRGGRMVLLTFTPQQEAGYWLNHYFPHMMRQSIQRGNTYQRMLESARKSGFSVQLTEPYFIHDGLCDLFCYAGKNNPELYFDPSVRAGISSFALWPEETNDGLARLRRDIDSGHFETIRKQYDNELGDYLFVVLQLSK